MDGSLESPCRVLVVFEGCQIVIFLIVLIAKYNCKVYGLIVVRMSVESADVERHASSASAAGDADVDSTTTLHQSRITDVAKTSEPIDVQFEMLSRLGPRNITWSCRCPHRKGHFWGCLAS